MPDIEGGISFFNAAPLGFEMLGLAQRLSRQSGPEANIHLMKSKPGMALANGSFIFGNLDYGISLVTTGTVTRLQIIDLKVAVDTELRARFTHPGVIVAAEAAPYNDNGDVISEESGVVIYRAKLSHPPKEVKNGQDQLKSTLYYTVSDSMVEAVTLTYGNPNLIFYTE